MTLSTDISDTLRPSFSALLDALSQPPELGIIQAAVRRFVAQRHAFYIASGLRPKGGLTAATFEITTLLQALAWERLDQADTSNFGYDDFSALLDQLLDSPSAKSLATELHEALRWDDEIDTRNADPLLLKQMVRVALILEIEPPALRKPCHVAGYDLCAEKNRGRSFHQLRDDIVAYLEWMARGVDGYRSRGVASLALCALEPTMPIFGVRDVPEDLLCGTLRWANFAHGAALADVLQPGAAASLNFQQLLELPLQQSIGADAQEAQVIAATRMMPAVQWAVTRGIVAHRENADYAEDDVHRALGALDEYAARLSRSTLAVLQDPPHRIHMAEQKLNELMGERNYLSRQRMRPSTTLKRMEYSLRNPSPRTDSSTFPLLDVFAAGYMKNGTDEFEPALQYDQQALLDEISPALDRLKGVDMPGLFDAAFATWYEEARTGYAFLIENLLEQIPRHDRAQMERGALTVYVLRHETGMPLSSETSRDILDRQGRFGFLLMCEHQGGRFYYEVFPFNNLIKRRSDLGEVPRSFTSGRHISRVRTFKSLDWAAYFSNQPPKDWVLSAVDPVLIRYLPAVSESTSDVTPPQLSSRLELVVQAVVHSNMFYDRERTYAGQRGLTAVEFVGKNYPPVLRLVEVLIPGLGCFNAVRTGQSPVIACALDVGAVMAAPLFGLMKGVLQVAVRSGQVGLLKTLPAFGAAAGDFIRQSGIAYRSALNPVALGVALGSAIQSAGHLSRATLARMASRMSGWTRLKGGTGFFRMPQRVNGRIGYPLSGRGAAGSSLGPRIRNVREYDAFLEANDIFQGDARLRTDMLMQIESGGEVRIHVRRDGSRTLIKRDSADHIFVDLADNSTVRFGAHYDHRALKSWAVENEASRANMSRLAIEQVTPGRSVLEPERLKSVKDAIESGAYLPPLDVRKTAEGYEIINGNHRLQAAVELKLENVPVIVRDAVGDVQASAASSVLQAPAPPRRNTI